MHFSKNIHSSEDITELVAPSSVSRCRKITSWPCVQDVIKIDEQVQGSLQLSPLPPSQTAVFTAPGAQGCTCGCVDRKTLESVTGSSCPEITHDLAGEAV